MLSFKNFLIEGGNISVGGVSASPIKITEKDRPKKVAEIRNTLQSIHDSFNDLTGKHLFGKNAKAIKTGSAFAGSTKQFMGKDISDSEYIKYKPSTGDVDAQIPIEHKDALANHLKVGDRHGVFTVAGVKKHGNEVSALLRHPSGDIHQVDFEGVKYDGDEPTTGEQFLHSSHWGDTKTGIKGAHHKVLLNAIGGDKHKFSITHGLRSRTDESDPGAQHPEQVSKTLFGDNADHSKVESFVGLTQLIKKHVPKEQHRAIYDKFKDSVTRMKNINNTAAIEHLRSGLNIKDDSPVIKEEEEHHTTVVPLTGFSPVSHMGHAKDLGRLVSSLPGTKHVGISSKSDLFTPNERSDVLKRQWEQKNLTTHAVKSAGETIARAHDSLPKTGRKVLHIVVGSDRKDFGEGLKTALNSGKIKEMGDNRFDEIRVHTPRDADRSHGMSGTKMRQAASDGNYEEFSRHIGPNFSDKEKKSMMSRIGTAIKSGSLKLRR